jgi:hypothetical protein
MSRSTAVTAAALVLQKLLCYLVVRHDIGCRDTVQVTRYVAQCTMYKLLLRTRDLLVALCFDVIQAKHL